MPIHIDIRINDTLIQRIHIARMSHSGTQPDSVNTYSAVMGEKSPIVITTQLKIEFPAEPTWLEWEEGKSFTHRYGDSVLICVQKALIALGIVSSPEPSLQGQILQLQAELALTRQLLTQATAAQELTQIVK